MVTSSEHRKYDNLSTIGTEMIGTDICEYVGLAEEFDHSGI